MKYCAKKEINLKETEVKGARWKEFMYVLAKCQYISFLDFYSVISHHFS